MKGIIMACLFCLLFSTAPYAKAAAEADHLILINLAVNQLSFFENGHYVRTFPISSGKPKTPTPEGTFCVINKYKNKKYHRKNIPGGAPNNPLGTRWLGLNEKEYAIHGTSKEWSIGTYESNGCIRMHNRDVQWLYDRVPLRTKVIMAKFYESPEYAAHRYGYRITSWNGQPVQEEQVGRLLAIDKTLMYWKEPHGQLIPVQEVLPNQKLAVFSHNGQGLYDLGNNFYILDRMGKSTRYEQVPIHIIANQYKRKYNVP